MINLKLKFQAQSWEPISEHAPRGGPRGGRRAPHPPGRSASRTKGGSRNPRETRRTFS